MRLSSQGVKHESSYRIIEVIHTNYHLRRGRKWLMLHKTRLCVVYHPLNAIQRNQTWAPFSVANKSAISIVWPLFFLSRGRWQERWTAVSLLCCFFDLVPPVSSAYSTASFLAVFNQSIYLDAAFFLLYNYCSLSLCAQ